MNIKYKIFNATDVKALYGFYLLNRRKSQVGRDKN